MVAIVVICTALNKNGNRKTSGLKGNWIAIIVPVSGKTDSYLENKDSVSAFQLLNKFESLLGPKHCPRYRCYCGNNLCAGTKKKKKNQS